MKITQNGQYPFYRPWDSGLAKQSLQDSWEGEFSILDLQLGSACNAHCRHCDSSCSSLHESANLDINEVVRLLGEMRQSRNYFSPEHQSEPLWCFICGLGEPTEPTENLPKLLELLDRTAEIGVNFALFNNGLYWDEKLNKHLGGGRLSVQVQVMSNQVEKVAHFMGVSKDEANLQLRHREQIYEVAVQQWDHPQAANGTNVCASIVPMRDNLDELPQLFYEAIMHNVYPLLGELEEAGYCTGKLYQQQKLTYTELANFRGWIRNKFDWYYQVPLCPATFGAIHIDNHNHLTVDRCTGAGCHWFDMSNPDPFDLGDFRNYSYREIANLILDYRVEHIEKVRSAQTDYPEMVFGGCGGNARPLLRQYLESYDHWYASQCR